MTILVDARYIGASLRAAHPHGSGISLQQMCMILGTTPRMLHKYERGQEIIPQEILNKLMRNGVRMLITRL